MLVISVGDTHFPWIYWRTIDRICERIESTRNVKNVHIIQMGDLYDQYSYSKFPRTHDLYTPKEEVLRGRKLAERMWDMFKKANPRAKCWQLMGNHDVRPYKRILERLPEVETFMDFKSHWSFDKVETILDVSEDLILGGVVYTHGWTKLGNHVAFTGKNTVCGHLHRGGVVTVRHGKKTLWEANAGFCANPHSVPLSYGPLNRYSKTTQGWLEVSEGWPTFRGCLNP